MMRRNTIAGVVGVLILIVIVMVSGCGTLSVKTIKTIDMDWGSISLLEGWKVVDNDGESVIITNIDFEHLTVYTNITDNPKNFETWAIEYAVSTGRTPGDVGSREIAGIKAQSFTTQARSGKANLDETLYLLPLDDENALSIVTAIPDDSSPSGQVRQILDSIKVVR